MLDKTSRATPKQEAFAHAYVLSDSAGKPSACYQLAYSAENMSAAAIAVEASRLLDNPKVSRVVDELKTAQRKRSNLTADDLRVLMLEAVELARDQANPAVLANNVEKLAKLTGQWTERVERTTKDLSADEAKPDAAAILRKLEILPSGENVVALKPKAVVPEQATTAAVVDARLGTKTE